jgi:hypothetical protein
MVVMSGFYVQMRKYHKLTTLEGNQSCSFDEQKHAFKFSYDMRVSNNNTRLERQLLINGLDRKRNLTLRMKIKA